MNDRDYLRSLGFTVGQRGRFSAEMKQALSLRDKDEVPQEPAEAPQEPEPLPKRTDGNTVYKAVLKGGIVIRFDICPQCKDSVVYCDCNLIEPPGWLADEVVEWGLERY